MAMGGQTNEFELIERLRERLGHSRLPAGPGDDAVLLSQPGPSVVSVDTSVEGVHFPAGWDDPAGIASRALAVALSDLAAMGAGADSVLVALGAPAGREKSFWLDLADGLVESTARFGVYLAGGDVVACPDSLFISVTAIGSMPEGVEPVSRAGASPGDLVGVTGTLGGARAGLALWTAGERGPGPDAIERYLAPVPLLEAGATFAREGASAMIDVSDGLLADLGHLARESGVRIELAADSIPVDPGVEAAGASPGAEAPVVTSLVGGDDYELALSFPPGRLDSLLSGAERAGTRLTVIGSVVEGEGVGPPPDLDDRATEALGRLGYEHSF